MEGRREELQRSTHGIRVGLPTATPWFMQTTATSHIASSSFSISAREIVLLYLDRKTSSAWKRLRRTAWSQRREARPSFSYLMLKPRNGLIWCRVRYPEVSFIGLIRRTTGTCTTRPGVRNHRRC